MRVPTRICAARFALRDANLILPIGAGGSSRTEEMVWYGKMKVTGHPGLATAGTRADLAAGVLLPPPRSPVYDGRYTLAPRCMHCGMLVTFPALPFHGQIP